MLPLAASPGCRVAGSSPINAGASKHRGRSTDKYRGSQRVFKGFKTLLQADVEFAGNFALEIEVKASGF